MVLPALIGAAAAATTFRCDTEGRVLYSDRPCQTGRQSAVVSTTGTPEPADRAAAESRRRADRAALVTIERERRRDDRLATAEAGRRNTLGERDRRRCAALDLRARRAREDVERAGPRDQPKARTKAQRAEEDRVVHCPRR